MFATRARASRRLADRRGILRRRRHALFCRDTGHDRDSFLRSRVVGLDRRPRRLLHRSAVRGHDGLDLWRRDDHLYLFRWVHVPGPSGVPVSLPGRIHHVRAAVHGLEREPRHAVRVLAATELSALSPGPQPRTCSDVGGRL